PPLTFTNDEMWKLVSYVAYQFVRTPAFRDMRARNSAAMAANARTLGPEQMRQLRLIVPPDSVPAGVADTDEEFEQLWREATEDAELQMRDKSSWLSTMTQFAQVAFEALWTKGVELLRADSQCFMTCDQPVVIDYDLWFGLSEVY